MKNAEFVAIWHKPVYPYQKKLLTRAELYRMLKPESGFGKEDISAIKSLKPGQMFKEHHPLGTGLTVTRLHKSKKLKEVV